MYRYYQIEGGEEAWKPVPETHVSRVVAEKSPMFVTVLSTDKLVSRETSREDKLQIRYLGPMYFDFDSADIDLAIKDLQSLCGRLLAMGLPMEHYKVYATGSKGFHVEIPMECFTPKVERRGYLYLPMVYKAVALKLAEDTMDFRVYSIGMGRMWRQPGVLRPNGKYKVRIDPSLLDHLTADMVVELTSKSEQYVSDVSPDMNVDLAVMFDQAMQDVTERMKGSSKKKRQIPTETFSRAMPSMELLMEGKGVRPGAGFNQLAMQIAIYAREAGIPTDKLIEKCQGLFDTHQSNGNRYNTPAKRAEELRRMCDVVADDPCFEYVPAATRMLLSHPAPDLDGVPVDREEIEEDVKQADAGGGSWNEDEAQGGETPVDEYSDVARGVELTKYGIYAETEFGKRRISSIGLKDPRILRSMATNKIACIEADVTVNGKVAGHETIEIDTFHTAAGFNKFASRYGHAFQGTEAHARAAYMRTIEKGKRLGADVYVHEREGLALVNIPHHDNEALREPFLVWADGKQVVTEPRVRDTGVSISFQGHPDPKGVYRCDLMDAPNLVEWIGDGLNKAHLKETLTNLFRCQKPDMLGSMLGWLTACYYKPLFQKAYNQFPLLHINGLAGSGKSQMSSTMAHFFYYNQEPKTVSPTSTVFALSQFASGTDSVPMIVDEYKPHEMAPGVHDRLKLMFRDAYNARDVQRGGGNRDNDNYRALTTTTLCAPVMFIAEAIEEETALMERVVLVTMSSPPPAIKNRFASRFMAFQAGAKNLAILGKYIASRLVLTGVTAEQVKAEFDPMYQAARQKLMMNEGDLNAGLSMEELQGKQQARERPVFNFTVAAFGLRKFRELIESICGEEEFKADFDDFEANCYLRLRDLTYTTMPEYMKVLNTLVDLSYEQGDIAHAVRHGFEYGFGNLGTRDTLELSARAAYSRYRQYCRIQGSKPLYTSDHAFAHSLRGVASLLQVGEGQRIQAPGGVFVFDVEELTRSGLRPFYVPRNMR